ncbi:phosphotransferase [Streptomyces sp. NPDC052013]|uniref:phosphotransferase n=1 Tax=Streptomyces sp. NPDC052013 TaxID=3365679 RepID=UPI0037D91DE9
MRSHPVPSSPPGRVAAHDPYVEYVRRAQKDGVLHGGRHNRNFVLPLTASVARLVGREAGTPAIVRMPAPGVLPVVIRTWKEPDILRAIAGVLPVAPECLAEGDGSAIHSYVVGKPLSRVSPDGERVDRSLVESLMGTVALMTRVRREALPWAAGTRPTSDKDSRGFLRRLVQQADRQVRQPHWPEFGGLFAALGVPADALVRLGERIPDLARRPYCLLHTDLHRDNLILPGDDRPVGFVDWEFATYGDPLYELATHLVRMRYPEGQWDEVQQVWAGAMERHRPAAVKGLARDLRHYVAFERAQSLYPDVMRAAKALDDRVDDRGLTEASSAVRAALEAAAEPLGLMRVPGEAEIEQVLLRWRDSRHRRPGSFRPVPLLRWVPDSRVPERPDFPRTAVMEALIAEGTAPAGRVFKGTAHLNSVVRVADVEYPVVVRRRLGSFCRREPSHLSEHAVLQAIERANIEVTAPKVLALGRSHGNDPFAVHTYVGPRHSDRPPSHPVDGLLPHEADGLVHQLAELTRVDCAELDPIAGQGDFYVWLSQQLVALVRGLPVQSQRLAKELGLPNADRLSEILSRHRVTPRRPALLHGDLNPWNLVRRPRYDRLAVTIIDWEMAMVGDPLYDLVRHVHLTPTRPEIRERMVRQWERKLAPEYTADWRRDWPVYRWVELVRSAYVDLDRLVTGVGLDAPNVRRAVDSYAMTLASASASLGLPVRSAARPRLARALD